jgi:Heavy metal binding domain
MIRLFALLVVTTASFLPHHQPAVTRSPILAADGKAPGASVSPEQVAASEGGQPAGALSLRFHHVHVKVADPASSMNALATQVQGTRVILQGLGVGVRSGGVYVLFDRADDMTEAASVDLTDLYRRAAEWLKARGASVTPPALGDSPLGIQATGVVDHVAFAAADLNAAVEALTSSGAVLVRRSDEVAVFAMGGGPTVEIVRDTDRPDAFWCPMHLDVRSAAAGTCSICSMELVLIPPPRLGEYRLDVEQIASRGRGTRDLVTGLRLRVRDPDGRPVTSFATVHEREFHLFIIGRSLDYFEHVHPEPAGEAGRFDLQHELPAGEYMLLADFLPYGGTTQMLQRAIVTPGYAGRLFPETPRLVEGPAGAVVDGVRVRVADSDLAAGKPGCLRFELSDASSNKPIVDLEPFLGAPAHLLIVKPDLTDAIHAHPEENATGGPTVSFSPLMPSPGLYKVWVQFQRRGKVSTASFVVRAR